MTQQTPQLIRMRNWMRKSTIRFFEHNPDAIAAPGFVALGSKIVVDIMSTNFEALSRDSFFITCRAREILVENVKGNIVNETDIFQAETSLNALFERLHDYFDTRIQQGEQKLQYAGFGLADVKRHTTNYETRSVTNGMTQYLDLLAKADLYLTILQYLWLTGELADSPDESMRHKLTTERDVRSQLLSITRASNTHYNNIRRICNGIIELRRIERQAQATKDRAIAKKRSRKQSAPAPAPEQAPDWKGQAKKKRDQNKEKSLQAAQSDMDALVT